jgi:hypothetical protein
VRSVDWLPGLVVAAGKDGQVSIFGCREVEGGGALPAGADVPPLLSARLHKGWIADVQFVRGQGQVRLAALLRCAWCRRRTSASLRHASLTSFPSVTVGVFQPADWQSLWLACVHAWFAWTEQGSSLQGQHAACCAQCRTARCMLGTMLDSMLRAVHNAGQRAACCARCRTACCVLCTMQDSSVMTAWTAEAGCGSGAPLGSRLLLLTAGNDGTLCLWDVAKCAGQGRGVQPQQLARCDDLHSGTALHASIAHGRQA